MLIEEKNNSAPITFKSYKARRDVYSAMAGKFFAFFNMFDAGATVAEALRNKLRRDVPLPLLTDSISLFDVISCPIFVEI